MSPVTGRTHQIRVHLQHCDHPILGDERYGEGEVNRQAKKLGLKRLFLHAQSIAFPDDSGNELHFTSPLADDLEYFWIRSLAEKAAFDGPETDHCSSREQVTEFLQQSSASQIIGRPIRAVGSSVYRFKQDESGAFNFEAASAIVGFVVTQVGSASRRSKCRKVPWFCPYVRAASCDRIEHAYGGQKRHLLAASGQQLFYRSLVIARFARPGRPAPPVGPHR